MKRILHTIITLLISYNTFAQAPAIQWQKCLGGSAYEESNTVQQTTDGGYIVSGYTLSDSGDVSGRHGGGDYWVVKLNSSGSIQWQKTLGGHGNDFLSDIQQTADGGYIVGGLSTSNDGDVSGNHGSDNIWLVKLSSTGGIQWQKSLGGSSGESLIAIQETIDGGYIVGGESVSNDGDVIGHHGAIDTPDYWVVKINSNGNIQWQKSLGGTDFENLYAVQQTSDGGYIIGGNSFSIDGDVSDHHGSIGDWDIWIVKLSSTGNIQWQKSLGGTGLDYFSAVKQTVDGGFIVGGSTLSNNGDVSGNHGILDNWIVKLNSVGSIQWQKSIGGTSSEHLVNIQQTTDSGYILGSYSYSNDGDVSGHHDSIDIWIVKLSSTGNIQWQKSLGGTGTEIGSVKQIVDGSYIISGFSSSNDGDVIGHHGSSNYDIWIVKLDNNGNIVWQKSMGGTFDERFKGIQQTNDGGYIVSGHTYSTNGDVSGNHGGGDIWVVKIAPDRITGIEEKQNYTGVYIFPNPAQTQLNLSKKLKAIEVYNINGQLQLKEQDTDNLNIESLTKGTYILKGITMQNENVEIKFVK